MPTLGTIGSGLMAQQIARLATAGGYEVLLSNSRGPESLSDLVTGLGDGVSASTRDEAAEADIVLLALPFGQLHTLKPTLLAGKIVIDITNYYPHRDGRIAELDSKTMTAGQYVQRHLTSARLVRAFSNIFFSHIPDLARPSGAEDRSALPVAGEDSDAVAHISALVNHFGFDTVQAGALKHSWKFEPETVAYLRPYAFAELEQLQELPSAPPRVAGAAAIKELLATAERTNQATRTF